MVNKARPALVGLRPTRLHIELSLVEPSGASGSRERA
jgi:hypothetical protein